MMTPPALQPDQALFLDFDGTLTELQDDAAEVYLPEHGPEILQQVSHALSGALAIISGRALGDLCRRVPDAYWRLGAHGLEIAAPCLPPEAGIVVAPKGLSTALQTLIRDHEGVWLEDKGRVQAVHYRRRPELGITLEETMQEVLGAFPEYRLQHGKMVIEAKPSGANKGVALSALMMQPTFAGARPVMVGDDTTDEDAMKAALALGGSAVKVGQGPSCATYRLSSPAEVWAWLKQEIV